MTVPHTRVSGITLDFSALKVLVDHVTEAHSNGAAVLVEEVSFYENGSIHIAARDFAGNDGEFDVYAAASGFVEENGITVRTSLRTEENSNA